MNRTIAKLQSQFVVQTLVIAASFSFAARKALDGVGELCCCIALLLRRACLRVGKVPRELFAEERMRA